MGDLATLDRRRHDRAAIDQRPCRDDHAARVLGQVARQAGGLTCQRSEPAPAAALRPLLADRLRYLLIKAAQRPAFAGAGDALDLPCRQAERSAKVADCAARLVGRESGDERCSFDAVALMDPRDQLLANVAREVEINIWQLGDLLT